MDAVAGLASGFQLALTLYEVLWALVGCAMGTAVGVLPVLPGVGPAVTIALLLPLTTETEPSTALIMFCGAYCGAMYGGSTTSILLNSPGESASLATTLEGNQMAKRGRGGPSGAAAAIASFTEGTIAALVVSTPAPPVAKRGPDVRSGEEVRARGACL